MSTIWKFFLADKTVTELQLPLGARVLTAQIQSGVVTLWVLLDPKRPPQLRRFRVTGTGWDMPDEERAYINTVQSGPLVWHIFEVLP